MLKNKRSNVGLNVIKLAVLGGISLQPLYPAFAGWDKDIFQANELDLKALNQKCVLRKQRTNTSSQKSAWEGKGKIVTEDFIQQKRKKWSDRSDRIMNLLVQENYDSLTLIAKKEWLIEDQSLKNSLKKPVSIVLPVIEVPTTRDAASDCSATGSTSSTNTSTITIVPSAIENEIQSLEPIAQMLGDSPDDRREKSSILARVAKLKKAQTAGLRSYASEEELNGAAALQAQPIALQPIDVAQEILSVSQLIGTLDPQGPDKENALTRLGKLKAARKAGKTSVTENELEAYTSIQPKIGGASFSRRVDVAKEIADLETMLPYTRAEQKATANARLAKLNAAKADGKTYYFDEAELDQYAVTITTTTTPQVATPDQSQPVQNTPVVISVSEEIKSLSKFWSDLPAISVDRPQIMARIMKLVEAKRRGITEYVNESDLDANNSTTTKEKEKEREKEKE